MNKKELSERDVCTKYITPAISSAGWDVQTQVRENVQLTAGWVIVRMDDDPRQGEVRGLRPLLQAERPLAIVEAKDNNFAFGVPR